VQPRPGHSRSQGDAGLHCLRQCYLSSTVRSPARAGEPPKGDQQLIAGQLAAIDGLTPQGPLGAGPKHVDDHGTLQHRPDECR
jgi:hypothetical protein